MRYYNLAAHRRVVNVLTSNSAFLICDVLVVIRPMIQDVLNC